MIVRLHSPLLKKKEEKVNKKLCSFNIKVSSCPNDPKVVTNMSSHVLSNEETLCLANGLNYGLVPKRIDSMNVVSNVEQFFHHVTDIFQQHKEFMKELRENEVKMDSDVRVLNTKELTLASDLRWITRSYLRKAEDFRLQKNKIDSKEEDYRHLLKKLKENTSIIITRPDKGRGVVVMDKHAYVSKMLTILNDSSKFSCLSEDPTIKREGSLMRLLLRLHNEKSITDQFLNFARPIGSNPGRLYGLPKIHKKTENVPLRDVPLRPVLSSVGTFNYRLAKALTHMFSDIIKKQNIIRDSFSFVKELKELPKVKSMYKMVSFDITSLYTNIPVDETIKIILKHLYEIRSTPPLIKQDDMEQLLIFATKRSHFLFDGKVYDQIDGVSMGSPLAPLLAEIFLQEFERKYLPSFEDMGIIYWKRYVDDTFVLLNPNFSRKDVCANLSKLHPSLQFTSEEENKDTCTLPFLGVLVQRQAGIGFHTGIYRKETFTGLITKWSSFVPKIYKYNTISTMIYRAIQLCSSNKSLHEEFEFIRELSTKNGYPAGFVDSIIGPKLNIINAPPSPPPSPSNTSTPKTETVVFRIPYIGKESHVYGKRITSTVLNHYPLKKIRLIYDVIDRIGRGFSMKDVVPKELISHVVYEATCSKCDQKYIGQTCRHLKTRMNEHLTNQNKFIPQLSKKAAITLKRNNNSHKSTIQQRPVTRSQTGKLPPMRIHLNQDDLNELFKETKINQSIEPPHKPTSAITKHYLSTGHVLHNSDFRVLLKEQNRYRLVIKESLLIKANEPKLNGKERSMPLYIFPNGTEIKKKQSKIKSTG
ncbi:unnamed protein product [Rotaria socialis]|uniref:Reverse transcriptase domain-containing protein n=1 Tax=Rotaria socialis TaxID=392032 RepID=A0A818MXP6_9BILA|nr:unnamed protein product [Rotaria socialis]CAF4603526.1 unnamed protein product [Rotaria socialis]